MASPVLLFTGSLPRRISIIVVFLGMKLFILFPLSIILLNACNNQNPQENNAVSVISEDSLMRFMVTTSFIPIQESKTTLASMIGTLQKDSSRFTGMVNLLSKPFSDPNSKYRNEDLYIQLLEAQLQSPWYIEAEKGAIRNKLKLAQQNRVGHPVNDFTYITPDGVKKRLYSVQAPYTLLYFHNPECHACKEMKASILASEIITRNTRSGRVKLFAMYFDADQALWRRHLHENPSQWINGRDENEYLWTNKIYDLRAIPTLYLLDEKKTVLLKDGTVPQIEEKLGSL